MGAGVSAGRAVMGERGGVGVVGVRGELVPEFEGEEEKVVEKQEGEGGGRWCPFVRGKPLLRFGVDVGEWLEYIKFKCVGERGGWRLEEEPFGI
jgi:hypothetical protein